jgi:hypothetical protein
MGQAQRNKIHGIAPKVRPCTKRDRFIHLARLISRRYSITLLERLAAHRGLT